MTHGDLFSGIGGFSLAASWAGWTNVFQCEKNEWCRRVLAKNFPGVKCYTNIKEFKAKEYEGKIDVISGGFPCQPFSVAGKQLSEKDDRYLWPEMLRIIREVKPSFVVCENVPGIIKLALDTVLSDLENEGYTTETFIIPACAKNAWHRRNRVWIIAYAYSNRNIGGSETLLSTNEKVGLQEWQQMEFFSKSSEVRVSTNTNGERLKEYRQSGKIPEEHLAPRCDSWWEAEPGMDRMVDGLPKKLDKNLIEYEKRNYQKTFRKIDFVRWEIMRNVWTKENLQRHHPSYNSEKVVILCQMCHTSIHMKDGTWGKGLKKTKICVICGKEFVPHHSKKHKTCSSKCLSQLGRMNALKRWRTEYPELKD